MLRRRGIYRQGGVHFAGARQQLAACVCVCACVNVALGSECSEVRNTYLSPGMLLRNTIGVHGAL